MKIHYYSGWFEDELPEQLAESLRKDIVDRTSIAIIWGAWGIEEYFEIVKNNWLTPAGIVFEKYDAIDTRMNKLAAQDAVKNASVILLTGGYTQPQLEFIMEYELNVAIEESSADVITGTSAGAFNMAKKYIGVVDNNYESEDRAVYDGLGLDGFAFEPYFSLTNRRKHGLDSSKLLQNHLLPLSQELDVYTTADDAAIRVENGIVKAVTGDVHLISDSEIRKL